MNIIVFMLAIDGAMLMIEKKKEEAKQKLKLLNLQRTSRGS
jgi:hypothetical protein